MKLCKDCRWLRRKAGWDLEFSECRHPSAERTLVSPVTGVSKPFWHACDMHRAGDCGYEAKFLGAEGRRPGAAGGVRVMLRDWLRRRCGVPRWDVLFGQRVRSADGLTLVNLT